MVMAIFALFSQISAMVLLITLEQIKLESCACTQIEAFGERNWWLYPGDAGYLSESGRNAAILRTDGGGHFYPFFLKLVSWFRLYPLNKLNKKAALALKIMLLKRRIDGYTQMMLGFCRREGEMWQT